MHAVKFLVEEAKASVNARDNFDTTCLMEAKQRVRVSFPSFVRSFFHLNVFTLYIIAFAFLDARTCSSLSLPLPFPFVFSLLVLHIVCFQLALAHAHMSVRLSYLSFLLRTGFSSYCGVSGAAWGERACDVAF